MKRLAILALIGSLLSLPTTAGAADGPLAENAENVTAFDGIQVWSKPEGYYNRLRIRRDGVVSNVPVRRSKAEFDPNIGPGPDGRPTVVYSRCGVVDRCDVYSYDIQRGVERRVPKLARRDCEETAPSIWKGRIAVGREGKGCTPGVYSLRRGKLKLLRKTGSTFINATDIRGTRVAWVGSGFVIGVLDATGRRKEAELYRDPAGEGEGTVVASATFGDDGRVYHAWSYYLEADPTRYAILRRGPAADDPCERANREYIVPADTDAPGINSVAVDGDDLYYVQAGTLYKATDPLSWSACAPDQR